MEPLQPLFTQLKRKGLLASLFDLNFQLVESEVPHSSGPPGIAYCPVCFELITEPVVYPCVHEVCKACFEQCVATGNLHCPVCRHRISSWARRSKRNGCVVDEARQRKIAESLEEALGSGDVAKRELPQYECSIQVRAGVWWAGVWWAGVWRVGVWRASYHVAHMIAFLFFPPHCMQVCCCLPIAFCVCVCVCVCVFAHRPNPNDVCRPSKSPLPTGTA